MLYCAGTSLWRLSEFTTYSPAAGIRPPWSTASRSSSTSRPSPVMSVLDKSLNIWSSSPHIEFVNSDPTTRMKLSCWDRLVGIDIRRVMLRSFLTPALVQFAMIWNLPEVNEEAEHSKELEEGICVNTGRCTSRIWCWQETTNRYLNHFIKASESVVGTLRKTFLMSSSKHCNKSWCVLCSRSDVTYESSWYPLKWHSAGYHNMCAGAGLHLLSSLLVPFAVTIVVMLSSSSSCLQ